MDSLAKAEEAAYQKYLLMNSGFRNYEAEKALDEVINYYLGELI